MAEQDTQSSRNLLRPGAEASEPSRCTGRVRGPPCAPPTSMGILGAPYLPGPHWRDRETEAQRAWHVLSPAAPSGCGGAETGAGEARLQRQRGPRRPARRTLQPWGPAGAHTRANALSPGRGLVKPLSPGESPQAGPSLTTDLSGGGRRGVEEGERKRPPDLWGGGGLRARQCCVWFLERLPRAEGKDPVGGPSSRHRPGPLHRASFFLRGRHGPLAAEGTMGNVFLNASSEHCVKGLWLCL